MSQPNETKPFNIDLKAFCNDIDSLRKELKQSTGTQDLIHFKRIEMAVWALALVGFCTAWIGINPIAIIALSAASFARWTILSHHISHRGYEKIADAPARYQSKDYGRGWRRFLHWLDWMLPEAWHYEHDVLHHYNLGELKDPDVPANKTEWLKHSKLPASIRCLFIFVLACIWKPAYYAPNTLNALLNKREGTQIEMGSWHFWSPKGKRFWALVSQCWLPYSLIRFGLIPACFLLISPEAWLNVLSTLLITEVVINLWTYLVIVPNHAGSDIYVFDRHPKDRATYYLHQVVGSVDYHCGGNLRDFMHGWLNYQIEHHLFPDLTCLQYQKAHPRVREICHKHGVPMVSQSLFKRLVRLVKIQTAMETQPTWPGIKSTNNENNGNEQGAQPMHPTVLADEVKGSSTNPPDKDKNAA